MQYGKVLAAGILEKGTFQSFRFKPWRVNRWLLFEERREVEKVFFATPLKFARISSGFNRKRKHPILGYTKAHLGVDYAAPKGTPVWAMAGGKVIFLAEKGQMETVRIEHGSGLVSGYAHLHKIRAEIKKGKRVKQKQVIGYVGSTPSRASPSLFHPKEWKPLEPKELKATRLNLREEGRASLQKSVKRMEKKLARYARVTPIP